MEKKSQLIQDGKNEVCLPQTINDFKSQLPSVVREICEIKNRVELKFYQFGNKDMKMFSDRINDAMTDFTVNLLDGMESLMTAYVALEELNTHNSTYLSTEKEASHE